MAESGWDFSSRWLQDPKNLSTSVINFIIPTDLNTLMALLQEFIADTYKKNGD